MGRLPQTMRSLVAPKRCSPSGFEVAEVPLPAFTHPNEVIIEVHAGAIMKGDCQRAAGIPIIGPQDVFPLRIGVDGSGVVVAIGSEVKSCKVGDAVYGHGFSRPAFSGPVPGFCSEYAITKEHMLLHKPSHLSFEEAASISGYTVTAYQTIRRGLQVAGEDSLEGKTVYIPAALSSGGFSAIQVARNVFGATRIISTVSTPKMKLVEQYLPGMVDQLIDYTTTNLIDVVPRGSVDFMVNTQWNTMTPAIPLLNTKTGIIASISSIPPSSLMREVVGPDRVPFWLGWLLDLVQLWYAFTLRGTNIHHVAVSGNPGHREDLEKAGEMIATGKVKAVYRAVDLSDIDSIRQECAKVDKGKGGIGRLVIRVKAQDDLHSGSPRLK